MKQLAHRLFFWAALSSAYAACLGGQTGDSGSNSATDCDAGASDASDIVGRLSGTYTALVVDSTDAQTTTACSGEANDRNLDVGGTGVTELRDGDTYRATFTSSTSQVLWDFVRVVEYSESEPNGPGCGICRQASVEIEQ